MVHEIKPDSKDLKEIQESSLKIFLAGSIEMGSAEKWASKVVKEIKDSSITKSDIVLFNPRRDSWDSSWEQRITNDQFRYQVNWEMNMLECSDIIFLYFSHETKSPISLLELGLYADSGKMIVCCPDGFWRKGNVEIVCARHGIPLYDDINHAKAALITLISSKTI
jgi:hypothetical protein